MPIKRILLARFFVIAAAAASGAWAHARLEPSEP